MHTPTPWHTRGSFDGSGDIGIVAGNELIAESYQAVSRTNGNAPVQDNAAFIVRACNAHDALVAALQAALPYLEDIVNTEGAKGASGPDEYGDGGWTHLENAERVNVIAEQVRSALALAAPQEATR